MGVTKMVSLINTFSAQSCMSVGKSDHKRVDSPGGRHTHTHTYQCLHKSDQESRCTASVHLV